MVDLAGLTALTDPCVHCGFCLPACPTYAVSGEEAESPRGRIHLIRQAVESGTVGGAIQSHLDSCLGCLACVPACPSGVRYDEILARARVLAETEPRGRSQRAVRALVFALFPHPWRLRAVRPALRPAKRFASLARRMNPSLGAMVDLAPAPQPRVRLPRRIPADGASRAVVGLLTGCVQSAFFSGVTAATARVLAREGCDVVIPPRQGCCGALSGHVGRSQEAARFARRTIVAFERAAVDYIVTDVAGCGSAMKEYADLLHDQPVWARRAEALAAKVRDVSELLVELGPQAPRHPVPMTVAYHDACHLAHAQRVRSQPRDLLAGIPSLTVVPLGDSDMCCGSAGVYNLLRPEAAAELGARKAAAVRRSGASVVVAGNAGCLLQIAAALQRDGGPPVATMHTIEILDASFSELRS
jgi:glycolate dehydrogenase iron-sulfur subunit